MDFLGFFKNVWEGKASWLKIAAALLVVSVICFVGRFSMKSPEFSLPQVELGVGFALLAALIGSLATASEYFSNTHRFNPPVETEATPVSTAPALGEIDFIQLVGEPKSKTLRIQITGEGEGMTFWKTGKAGELRAWLDVVNFTNAPIKIEKMVGQIQVSNSTVAKFTHDKRETIPAHAAVLVHLQEDLSSEQIEAVAFQCKQQADALTGLSLIAYIKTGDTEMELRLSMVTGNNRFVNFHLPT